MHTAASRFVGRNGAGGLPRDQVDRGQNRGPLGEVEDVGVAGDEDARQPFASLSSLFVAIWAQDR